MPRFQLAPRYALTTAILALALGAAAAQAQAPTVDHLVSAVVRIKTFINPDARTAETLGREAGHLGVQDLSLGLLLTPNGAQSISAHEARLAAGHCP
jgi:hypothetical protein